MSIDDMTETQMRNILKEIEGYVEQYEDPEHDPPEVEAYRWSLDDCCRNAADGIFETLREMIDEKEAWREYEH